MPSSIASLLALLQTHALGALGALLVSWAAGKGLVTLLTLPSARRYLGLLLSTAKAPAVVLGKYFQAGPLHLLVGPFLCLIALAIFWLLTFLDKLLEQQKPDVQNLVERLEVTLAESGSTDRRLYLQAKTMTAAQVAAVSKMADAVSAPADEVPEEARAALQMAEKVGAEFQAERLGQ